VYALYQQYNFDQAQIAVLFIAGFLSSAVFGTLIGAVADTLYGGTARWRCSHDTAATPNAARDAIPWRAGVARASGRKRLALTFCVVYSLSCLTKLSPDFWVLMFGRILAGIATSLLFSVFEAWLVCEHGKKGTPPRVGRHPATRSARAHEARGPARTRTRHTGARRRRGQALTRTCCRRPSRGRPGATASWPSCPAWPPTSSPTPLASSRRSCWPS